MRKDWKKRSSDRLYRTISRTDEEKFSSFVSLDPCFIIFGAEDWKNEKKNLNLHDRLKSFSALHLVKICNRISLGSPPKRLAPVLQWGCGRQSLFFLTTKKSENWYQLETSEIRRFAKRRKKHTCSLEQMCMY